MRNNETRLEMRTRKLADAIGRRVNIVSDSLRPPGQRPSFTTMFSKQDALNWWLKNWSNPATGGLALSKMDPLSQAELHAALSKHIESQNAGAIDTGGQMNSGGMMGGTLDAAQTSAAPSIGQSGLDRGL